MPNLVCVSSKAKFYSEFKFVKKDAKKSQTKRYRPKTFAHSNKRTKLYFYVTFSFMTFLHKFFCNFFNGFQIAPKFVYNHIAFFKKKTFLDHISSFLFLNFELKCGRKCSKNKTKISWLCLGIKFLQPSTGWENQGNHTIYCWYFCKLFILWILHHMSSNTVFFSCLYIA